MFQILILPKFFLNLGRNFTKIPIDIFERSIKPCIKLLGFEPYSNNNFFNLSYLSFILKCLYFNYLYFLSIYFINYYNYLRTSSDSKNRIVTNNFTTIQIYIGKKRFMLREIGKCGWKVQCCMLQLNAEYGEWKRGNAIHKKKAMQINQLMLKSALINFSKQRRRV